MRLAWRCIGGKGLQIGVKVDHVLRGHMLIGGIGKGGVKVFAVTPDAALQGVAKVLHAPRADAVVGIGRDVRGEEGAKG